MPLPWNLSSASICSRLLREGIMVGFRRLCLTYFSGLV